MKRTISFAIIIICHFSRGIYGEEIIIDSKSNNYDDSIEKFYQQRIFDQIIENENAKKELVLRIPEFGVAFPLVKFEVGRHSNSTNRTRCDTDLRHLASSLTQKWALPLIDSYGKPPSGILRGNLFWTGNYDQCRSFVAPKTLSFPSGFKGRYCVAYIKPQNTSNSIKTAICVPNTCDSADLNNEYSELISFLNQTVILKNYVKDFPEISINCLPESSSLNASSIVFIVLVSIVTAFILAGTGYDIYGRYNPWSNDGNQKELSRNDDGDVEEVRSVVGTNKTWIWEFLTCFSALKNGESILDTSDRPGQLNCLHGIRFISMIWVILGHTYVFGLAQIGNTVDILDKYNNWSFYGIANGQFSVDTFFLLSGFLLTYLFLKDKSPFTLKKLVSFYSHRYIRLTPVYMLVIFAYASLYNFLGDGPYWPYQDQDTNICTKYWWKNILYINNMFRNEEDCVSWSWYLANDTQFYIISPLFLVFLKSQSQKRRYFGQAIIFVLLLITWITTIILVVTYNVIIHNSAETLKMGDTTMFDKLYNKPWTRMSPYLIGCLLGYAIVDFKRPRHVLPRIWMTVLWIAAIGLALGDVYGIYKTRFNLTTSAFYYGLSHSSWSIAVGWVIFACLTGHGGPVDKFLSWKFFFPLSRLTYCAYLVHPIVMMYYYQNLRAAVIVTNGFIAVHYLGFTVLTYGVALVTSLAFESPVIRLEKLIREGVSSH